ncbi:hypothetical protein [Candidatus Formimonas warabiya]|uniref:Uncharacterized protein n=1 Tax=Formimonas warabiya TaxID=1761012 RepID=A0A3G1KQZ4_FORW1|nr:hypothetical protein [Candidatus Formimonas warabiya]ATW24525.1 hypothetical protein DCMF_06790 [Candidatus Formimonas warabiya]
MPAGEMFFHRFGRMHKPEAVIGSPRTIRIKLENAQEVKGFIQVRHVKHLASLFLKKILPQRERKTGQNLHIRKTNY